MPSQIMLLPIMGISTQKPCTNSVVKEKQNGADTATVNHVVERINVIVSLFGLIQISLTHFLCVVFDIFKMFSSGGRRSKLL